MAIQNLNSVNQTRVQNAPVASNTFNNTDSLLSFKAVPQADSVRTIDSRKEIK